LLDWRGQTAAKGKQDTMSTTKQLSISAALLWLAAGCGNPAHAPTQPPGGMPGPDPEPVAKVLVDPPNGLTTTEAGGTASFGIVLTARPSTNVTMRVWSDDEREGKPTVDEVQFTPDDWSKRHQVVVKGVDDADKDGDRRYHVMIGATVSDDPAFQGLTAGSVAILNIDDDKPAVLVSKSGPLAVDEKGGATTFDVRLSSRPKAEVTIELENTAPNAGDLTPATLVFDPLHWDVPQTVAVTSIDDDEDDGDVDYQIVLHAAHSSDVDYLGYDPADVKIISVDDDTAGMNAGPAPLNRLSDASNEQRVVIPVVLTSRPTADVTIRVESSDAAQLTAAPATVVFTKENWNRVQEVTVRPVHDSVVDGEHAVAVRLTPGSSDAKYAALAPAHFDFIVDDGDTAGLSATTAGYNSTFEKYAADPDKCVQVAVWLSSKPSAKVVLEAKSSNEAEGTVWNPIMELGADNWDGISNYFRVCPKDDDVLDGPQRYQVTISVKSSDDRLYAGLPAKVIDMVNEDDESVEVRVNERQVSFAENERRYCPIISVRLGARPSGKVTVGVVSTDTSEGKVDRDSIDFDASNWKQPVEVWLCAVDDLELDGTQSYQVVFAVTSTADPAYEDKAAHVNVQTFDNEYVGLTGRYGTTRVLYERDAGRPDKCGSMLVRLGSAPSDPVTVSVMGSDATEAALDRTSLTFDATNWNQEVEVHVCPLTDGIRDGEQEVYVRFAVTATNDPIYKNIPAFAGTFWIQDKD
jgi:hypothetical protein